MAVSPSKKLLPLLFSPLALAASAQNGPNVLLIVTDDLGYGDLAAYGNPSVRTPHMDALGADGVRFTRAYCSSPISGPSRAGILTGRCQNRYGCEFMPYDRFSKEFMKGYKKYYLPPLVKKKPEGLKAFSPNVLVRRSKYRTDLPDSEITLAELMKRAGYATALVGKWNLDSGKANSPAEHGYDYSYYFTGALTRYIDAPTDTARYVDVHAPWAFSDSPAWQKRSGPTAIREGDREVRDTTYLTFSFAQKACEFIGNNREKPFFLTLTFNAPHDPFQAPREYWERIAEPDPVKRVYYAMIEALDDAVGRVTDRLKELGLYENTLIIFTSDNGGAAYTRATENAPLTGGKCTFFEGGLRVPFYVKFPGEHPGLEKVYEKPVSTLDIFTTICGNADVALPSDREYDGRDLLPYVDGRLVQEGPHDCLFWRNGYVKACLSGDWKLYMSSKDKRLMLYDLSKDPDEQHNLAGSYPDKVAELQALLQEWERTQTVDPLWPSSGDFSQPVGGVVYRFPV